MSANVIIIVLLGLAAIMFVLASFTGGRKWRRSYEEEREEYAGYAESTDSELRAARERIAELERDYRVLQQEHSDALVGITQLKAEAATRAVRDVPPAVSPAPPEALVEEAPSAPPPLASVPPPADTALETPAEVLLPPPVAVADVEAPQATAEPEPATGEQVEAEALPIVPEHRPIAPEKIADAADARPIAPFGATVTELPPAPIFGLTPLRAPAPDVAAEPEIEPIKPAAPVIETAIPESPTDDLPASYMWRTPEVSHVAAAAAPAIGLWHAINAAPATEKSPAAEDETPPTEPVAETDEPAAIEPIAETVSAPSVEETPAATEPVKTWFGSAKRDDLLRMRGVDPVMNTRLFGLGVTSFDDIVHLSQEDEMALEQRLGIPAGYITREQWREQANLLRFGKDDEFTRRFGRIDA